MTLTLTKQQAIYDRLKEQILKGKLKPGQRLIIDDIARELGLSIIPVREALRTLQSERLVENRPHVGATVTALTPQNVEEIFTVLEGMESVAVRRIAGHLTPAQDAALLKLIAQMDIAEKANATEKWSALNMEFHLALSEATGMPWLKEITERALSNWDRIRRHFFREGGGAHRFAEAQREHHAILKALRKGDADEAERIIRQHNQRAVRNYAPKPSK
jgi:DNA-binding GntR family transcriptional regulator